MSEVLDSIYLGPVTCLPLLIHLLLYYSLPNLVLTFLLVWVWWMPYYFCVKLPMHNKITVQHHNYSNHHFHHKTDPPHLHLNMHLLLSTSFYSTTSSDSTNTSPNKRKTYSQTKDWRWMGAGWDNVFYVCFFHRVYGSGLPSDGIRFRIVLEAVGWNWVIICLKLRWRSIRPRNKLW